MATFGKTTAGIGGGTFSLNSLYGSLYTLPENGVVVSMTIRLARQTSGSDPSVKAIIVRATDLTIVPNGISKPQVISNVFYGTSNFTWVDFYFDVCPYLTAGDYYLCFITNNTSGPWKQETSGVGTRLSDASNSYTTPSDPIDANTSTSASECVYATYYTPDTFTYKGVVKTWDGANWTPRPVYENDPGFTEHPVYACTTAGTWSLIQSF